MKAEGIKKTLKIAGTLIWWLFIIFFIILLINVLSAKFRGKVPSVFGYSVLRIVSGSMEDEIPINSYILVKKADPSEIKEGDIISFYSSDPTILGVPNTHRVAEPPICENGAYSFVTKGDANPVHDAYNAQGERLIGIYVCRLGWLNSLAEAFSGNTMIVIFIILQAAVCGITVYSVLKKKKPQENGK